MTFMKQEQKTGVILPERYNAWLYISTNYNNKFAFDFNPYSIFNETRRTYNFH
jgi:hypothetical protein